MKTFIKQRLRKSLLNETIAPNCDCCKYFDMDSLDDLGSFRHPLYHMLEKFIIDELEFMSPKEYLEKVSEGFGLTYQQIVSGAFFDLDKAKEYANEMKNGSKFPIPHYTYGDSAQEGRHRAYSAMLLGCNTIPVIKKNTIDKVYISDFLIQHKDDTYDELNNSFKQQGYQGISSLDWRTFKNAIQYRL